jgi:hypothetical protein
MQVKQLFTASLLSLAAAAVFAGQPVAVTAPLTRAAVQESVRAAAKAGELLPAGDAADYPRSVPTTVSTLTRSAVRQETLMARNDGELIPAGESDEAFSSRADKSGRFLFSRDEVKTATRQAQQAGELVPAGEDDDRALARDRAQEQYARMAWLAHHPASVVAVAAR